MKKALLSTIAIVGIVSGTTFAAQNTQHNTQHNMAGDGTKAEMHHATTTGSNGESSSATTGMVHMQDKMMGGKGRMMKHCMMGTESGMMRHGKMHGMPGKMNPENKARHAGMKGHAMMGLGFHMPGQENWTAEQNELFLNSTSDIRKELVVKRYEIAEAKRNANTTPDQLGKLDKELIDIRTKLQKKALEINAAAPENK